MTGTVLIAVTGANGFLGTAVARLALQQGIFVRGIVRSDEAAAELGQLGIKAFVCNGYAIGDLEAAFRGAMAVVHLVAITRGSKSHIDEVNVKLLGRVLDAARKAGVPKVIHLSGLGVGVPVACTAEVEVYLRSKEAAESLVERSGMEYTILRPSFIIGPGDGFTRAVVESISSGYVRYPGLKDGLVQPVAIDDAAGAIIKAATTKGSQKNQYDLVGPEAMAVDTLVMAIYQAIRDAGVKIAPPVIERVPPGQRSEGIDESFEFLGCTIRGDPAPLMEGLGLRPSNVNDAIVAAVRAILKPDEQIPEKRAVMLFSGGLDSVTTLYWMRSDGYDVIPLSMHYHNRPARELKAVEHVCKALGIKAVDVPVPYIMEVFELKLAGYPVPSLFGSSDYYVPYRNLVFNAIATYFADIYGARYIISGHITSDPLPDASQPFFDAIEKLVAQLKVGNKAVAPTFILPLKGKTKADVVILGKSLGVPFEWTWSCAFDEASPCGHCKPCRERAEAFAAAGLVDPVIAFRPPPT
ncbi:MAG: 7-cyano-7-deazaguanine synthase [Candidatus Lokiarchaeota archaeon]|nr:7-cyano-7-deazaguanine synthase [Candidatus Lokiarchaeota archaeon]